MILNWQIQPTFKSGLFIANAILADGCSIKLIHDSNIQEQKAEIKMQLNGVNYNKTFHRYITSDNILETAEPWIIDETKQHLASLRAIMDSFCASLNAKVTEKKIAFRIFRRSLDNTNADMPSSHAEAAASNHFLLDMTDYEQVFSGEIPDNNSDSQYFPQLKPALLDRIYAEYDRHAAFDHDKTPLSTSDVIEITKDGQTICFYCYCSKYDTTICTTKNKPGK